MSPAEKNAPLATARKTPATAPQGGVAGVCSQGMCARRPPKKALGGKQWATTGTTGSGYRSESESFARRRRVTSSELQSRAIDSSARERSWACLRMRS